MLDIGGPPIGELIRVMGEFRKVVDTVNVDEPWLTLSESVSPHNSSHCTS